MWTIMKNALRERMRRRELYIIVAVGIILLLLCTGNSMQITIDGEPIASFRNMFFVLHTIVNVGGCLLGAVLSIWTIPNEYARKCSHLVWVRGISQRQYHAGLAIANILGSMAAAFILYATLGVYTALAGEWAVFVRMPQGFLILMLNVALISLFTSALSIVLPPTVTGVIGVAVALAGSFHGILDTYRSLAGGMPGKILSVFLKILPDFSGMETQARNLTMEKPVDTHIIFVSLFMLYVVSLGILFFRRKEA